MGPSAGEAASPDVGIGEGVSAVSQPSDGGAPGKILLLQTTLPLLIVFLFCFLEPHANMFGQFGNTME